MCKKLIVLCLALMSVPAMAEYIGFPSGCENPLYVDVDGGGTTTDKCDWQQWLFARDWTGPISQQFVNPYASYAWEQPVAQLEAYRKNQAVPAAGASRDRSGGWSGVLGTGEFQATDKGFGMNYIKLTVTQLQPSTQYKFLLWAMETRSVWACNSDNPDSKYIAWSTTNPKQWLDDHTGQYRGNGAGTDVNGYGPISKDDDPFPITDTNMPGSLNNPYTGVGPSLYELVTACSAEGGRTTLIAEDGNDHLGQNICMTDFLANTNDEGTVVIYGWMDATDYTGSMHVPLNGFWIVPEPTTIALLGLGGLALIRRKRA